MCAAMVAGFARLNSSHHPAPGWKASSPAFLCSARASSRSGSHSRVKRSDLRFEPVT
jgi:hypothetical protein